MCSSDLVYLLDLYYYSNYYPSYYSSCYFSYYSSYYPSYYPSYYFNFYFYYYFITTPNITFTFSTILATFSTISIELFIRLDVPFIKLFIETIIRLPSILVLCINRALEL